MVVRTGGGLAARARAPLARFAGFASFGRLRLDLRVYTRELQVLRFAQDDGALVLLPREALDDFAMLRVLRGQHIALCHFEVGEVEAGGDGAADKRIGVRVSE